MKKNSYKVIGVMSGTSLDGIDLAVVDFTTEYHWSFEIKETATISYPVSWKRRLSEALDLDVQELANLDEEYTIYLAGVIDNFIRDNSLDDIDAVCSHGHTIKHEPQNGFTLQIGNLPLLAEKLGQRVVCDFRVQDVNLGGQGAPLVPIGDRLLFGDYKFCVNLGGFANISTEASDRRVAYDICPVNTVLNFYAEKLGQGYDDRGKIAASGKVDEQLLGELNEIAFYSLRPPKSLGIEWVKAEMLPKLKPYEEDIPSILATFNRHVAGQIAGSLDNNPASEVLLTGGGAYNAHLVELIRKQTACRIVVPSEEIIDYKEALIFGLLGVLKLRGEVNVLSSVTGAGEDHSSGVVFNV